MKVCVGAECVGDYGDSDDSCLDTQQTDDAQCHQLECRELGHANTRRRVEHDSHVRLALTACTTMQWKPPTADDESQHYSD